MRFFCKLKEIKELRGSASQSQKLCGIFHKLDILFEFKEGDNFNPPSNFGGLTGGIHLVF